jgi:hypothetical protein
MPQHPNESHSICSGWRVRKIPPAKRTVSPEESPAPKRSPKEWNRYEGPWLTLSLGALVIFDFNAYQQDEENVAQVGDVQNEGELRAGRVMLRGTIGRKRRVSYFYAGEYNGLSREPGDSLFRLTDFAFTINFHRVGDLTIGKTKEPISLARIMPGDGVLLMERATNDALVPSRSTSALRGRLAGSTTGSSMVRASATLTISSRVVSQAHRSIGTTAAGYFTWDWPAVTPRQKTAPFTSVSLRRRIRLQSSSTPGPSLRRIRRPSASS